MDLQIEINRERLTLSSLGLIVKDIRVSNASLETERIDIKNRNGRHYAGSNYKDKQIKVSAYFYAVDQLDVNVMRDKLYGVLATAKPFFITEMYDNSAVYEFERPGEITTQTRENETYMYGYQVLLNDDIELEFHGKTDKGLLHELTASFVTANLPFGMTPKFNLDLTGSAYVPYSGSAPLSQLEQPFMVKLTADQAQGSSFNLKIGAQTFTYKGKQDIKKGDVFEIQGYQYLLNGQNITEQTNLASFVIEPTFKNAVPISTTFKGKVELLDMVELYV